MKTLPVILLSLGVIGALNVSAQAEGLDLETLLDRGFNESPVPAAAPARPARNAQRSTGLQSTGLRTSGLSPANGLGSAAMSERLSKEDWQQLFVRQPKTITPRTIQVPR